MPNADTVYSGTLIGESVKVDAESEGIPLSVTKVSRVRVSDEPDLWTLIYFEVAADRAADLAEALSRVLARDGGWYCDFRSDDEVFVVFCDRVFRYRRGDRTARSVVEDYARSMGSRNPSSTGPDSRTWPGVRFERVTYCLGGRMGRRPGQQVPDRRLVQLPVTDRDAR